MLRTRTPLYRRPEGRFLVRLACVKRAANVRSEPGSNSPVEKLEQLTPDGVCRRWHVARSYYFDSGKPNRWDPFNYVFISDSVFKDRYCFEYEARNNNLTERLFLVK